MTTPRPIFIVAGVGNGTGKRDVCHLYIASERLYLVQGREASQRTCPYVPLWK